MDFTKTVLTFPLRNEEHGLAFIGWPDDLPSLNDNLA